MEFRIRDLFNEFDNKLSLISQYLDKKEIDIKLGVDVQQDCLPLPYELKNEPNKRREGPIARVKKNIIYYSPLSSQMIWYIAWLAYLIKESHEDILNIDDFIFRLIEVDKGENNDLTCKNLYAWDNEDLNSIFLFAMSFLICHEIGHIVYQHPGYFDENGGLRDPERSKRNELQADSFAADCILEISRSDESAKYGILVAQLALLFIRNENVSFDTHPDPATRLRNTLDKIDITPTMERFIERARELSDIYVDRRFGH